MNIILPDKQYFTIGSLEEELKKIAKIAGASRVSIIHVEESDKKKMESAESIISYSVLDDKDIKNMSKIGIELKQFLEAKNYKVQRKPGIIITNAKLLFDKS